MKAFMCLEVRSCLSFLPFRFFPRGKIHFPIAVYLCQSSGKVEKFPFIVLSLDALRGFEILVSVRFDLLAVFDVRGSFWVGSDRTIEPVNC